MAVSSWIGAGIIGLVEVLFHVSRGVTAPPSPLGGGWIVWIVVWCVIAAVVSDSHNFRTWTFDGGGVNVLGSSYDYDVEPAGRSQVVSQVGATQGVTRVVLDNIHGNLTLRGDDSGDVKVTGRKSIRAFNRDNADRANHESRLEIEHQGNMLLIRAVEPERSGTIQITNDLDIVIPRGLSVEARGRSGDLTVDDINGGVDVTAGRGDIHLTHIGQNIKIEGSRSGIVRISDVKGNFDLEGRGSDIESSKTSPAK